jgi:hypothetical protein
MGCHFPAGISVRFGAAVHDTQEYVARSTKQSSSAVIQALEARWAEQHGRIFRRLMLHASIPMLNVV